MIIHVLAVIFVATVIRSGFGFGEALIAVPLLAFVMPAKVAVPLAGLVSITVAVIVLAQDWHKVHIRSAVGLFIATLFGTPLGLWLLTAVEEAIVKAILACIIIGFSLFCLIGRDKLHLSNDRLGWFFGFTAGILGGAYGMNGPPLAIYGSLRRWSPEHFRATLQGYFLPASLVGMIGYWWNGLWVWDVTWYYLISLPATVAAIVVGRLIVRRVNPQSYIALVHIGLIFIGSLLLVQSIWKGVHEEPVAMLVGQASSLPGGWQAKSLPHD